METDELLRQFWSPILDESGRRVGWEIHAPEVKPFRVEGLTPAEERMWLLAALERSREKITGKKRWE